MLKNRMRFKGLTLGLLLAALITGAGPAAYAADSFSIGAMRPGSAWYVFGATLAQLLKPSLPKGSNPEVIARGGGVSNPAAVDKKKATIALSNVASALWAYNGLKGVYKQKHEGIRALIGGLNKVRVTAMVTESYIKRTGNDTLEKALLSKPPARIVMKPAGSTVPVVADMLMAALGTSRKDMKARGGKIIQVAANQIPAIIKDGRADLYFEVAIPRHPTVTEVTTTNAMRFLSFPPKALKALAAHGLRTAAVPGKWFKGIKGKVLAVDLGTVLIAHKDMPDSLAYTITKTLAENKKAMGKAHAAWRFFKPENGGKPASTGVPLHPGAAKYFKEKGWL